jgi:hypothetical protein
VVRMATDWIPGQVGGNPTCRELIEKCANTDYAGLWSSAMMGVEFVQRPLVNLPSLTNLP